MRTLENGAQLHYQPIAGNWSASVPVGRAEQRTEVCDGPEHQGKDFRTDTLYIFYRGYIGRARYKLFGPNLRQDGSEGRYRMGRETTREYADEVYPDATTALAVALGTLAELITADAETARAEIQSSIGVDRMTSA